MNSIQTSEAHPPGNTGGVKKVLRAVIQILLAVFVALCIGELGLRVGSHFSGAYRSSPFREYDPALGISLIPNKHVIHQRGCFNGEVLINRWGMRDRDRSLEKNGNEFRIALIGDSVVEGVHVKPDEVMNIRMEKILEAKGYNHVEVMNFSVEGIGTTQELLMYQERVRRFHPDLVVLAFVENDIMNNSSTLQPQAYGIHTWYAPYYDLGPNGELVFRPVESRSFSGLRSYLEQHSLLTYYLERAWFRVNIPLHKWHGIYVMWGAFGDPLDPDWQQAWAVTEKVMTKFRNAVEADGARFLVVRPPGFYDVDPDWRDRFIQYEGRIPTEFNVAKFDERLLAIGERNHISIKLLAPYFRTYRDTHNLRWPYFALTCDPHYSALGHEVTAQAIVGELQENHLLPVTAGNLSASPPLLTRVQ